MFEKLCRAFNIVNDFVNNNYGILFIQYLRVDVKILTFDHFTCSYYLEHKRPTKKCIHNKYIFYLLNSLCIKEMTYLFKC